MEPNPSESAMPQATEVTASPLGSQEALQDELDSVLISYLEQVDGYTTLRKQITGSISSGYLNLAHANFNVSGRRFGQDFYDERAKAMKGVQIEFDETSEFPKFQLRQLPLQGDESVDQGPSKPKVDIKSELRRRKPNTDGIDVSDAPLPKESDTKDGNSKDNGEESESKIVKRDPREPLIWFGILVPQSLREAQANFSRVVDMLPELATTLHRMNYYEGEIRRLRTEIEGEKGHNTATDTTQLEDLIAGVKLDDGK
ncbi:hypothetical protein DFH27DRAFT_525152 [Peziza echinospora]|nr:hypothetical protein DFH27DRAFT_525152 [Peziza echinospora]